MADPITIIGAAGAVANIIDVLGKTINALRELHNRWKEADFTFINLIAQLTALKAALNQIQEWIDSDVVEPYHQLVMDLEVSVSCCRMLIDKMDSQVSELSRKADYTLESKSKMTLIVKSGTLEELQKMVERQTIALTLLLSACSCKAISEQKTLLEQTTTRKIFQRVRDDSSSLYVQRDSASLSSRWTDSLSKISKVFNFDRELFVSKVYERALRNSLKDTVENLRRQHPRVKSTPEDITRSYVIDHALKQDSRRLSNECKILLLGDSECGQTILKQMKIHHDGYTDDVFASYQAVVKKNVLDAVKSMVSVTKMAVLDEPTKIHAELLYREMEKMQTSDANITIVAADAVQRLWASQNFQSSFEAFAYYVYIPESAPYFLGEIHRIVQKDYIPTISDILRAKTEPTGGIEETRFSTGALSIHIFDISGQRSELKKWINHFENITSIIFVVDLCCYDQMILEEPNQTRMLESLNFFGSIVNSRWFMRTSIILFFSNYDLFRQKLFSSPLCFYFPDYAGGNDIKAASEYILGRFNQVNRGHLSIYPHFTQASDYSHFRLVHEAIKHTFLLNVLKRSGLFDNTPSEEEISGQMGNGDEGDDTAPGIAEVNDREEGK